MQKSTPLSQLPTSIQQVPITPPIPPPQTHDVLNEDVNTIQDALEALNTGNSPEIEQMQPERYLYDPDLQNLLSQQTPIVQDVDMKTKIINDVLSWNSDLKIALFAAGLFLLIHSVPVEQYIYRYVSLDKIPHSQLLVKALLMFIGVLVVSKLLQY